MRFAQHPSNISHQLKRHEAALMYHQQKSFPPPDLRLSIGNVFQDGTTKLPVMQLPEHHLARLQEVRAQRLVNFSFPTNENQRAQEGERITVKKMIGEG
ncbi:hypothetical protein SBOR_4968 [Sclerotinia borealis F-4128]|uniref:Uncharacterized protein n=1 Tax=Sclerotinia borealis (strain F-4128) TaxID=1432307 RepID=W9CIZ4_SCLBF|nr:hypothetical protein SBOR_4968 [Sclerotinia borealis F-4128]